MAGIFWDLILFIWELPQNLVGLILRFVCRKKIIQSEKLKGRNFYKVRGFGISLGRFIFWSEYRTGNNKAHEFGHSVQSGMLGPFYLIIVGLPSVIRASYARYYLRKKGKYWEDYFKGFPENWADSLGEKFFKGFEV